MKIKIANGLVEHAERYESIELEVTEEQYEFFKNNKDRRFNLEENEMEKITKEEFEDYENVRESGRTNMFMVRNVVALSRCLTVKTVKAIMENYEAICEMYPGVRK